ncbi:cytochrome c oxidase accessory protein CcoG [Polymorphum gilvum]|uniref:Cytochrome c oxidase accessory protein CcoG n=1 Tax=Polymorphum gilvum (strain LMG 25793 / CGMCC 1.9160 / SL003B-26A1) TaxID=991905 RepID=F2IXK7_POLGS|nr:cytochrome c oxidase accessory protein CcoG [Polymorphum gilvum]ADZ71630.1 Cytochrome c oxidase accessory protein CcoG [Polymorphum gilvum SL003B-26A1]
MRVEPDAAVGSGQPDEWFASAKKIYPMATHGTFRRIKWALLFITLGIYYLLPFVRWDRGPEAPDQAVLIDLAGRRAYFFFIEIWPQEVYYLTGLLIVAAMALFLMNAVAGRIWCGYLCPQTVWTDLFLWVERKVEGDRRERIAFDKAPWTAKKVARRATKHFLWLMIAWWTGGAWVLYFADAPTIVYELATFQAPVSAYVWIGILTATTYLLAGFMREQVCIYMCPWPRIQAALTDEKALNVTYRWDRGEPRGSLKHNRELEAKGLPAGDCIDCNQCYFVCPTGVDIRKGMQLDCIQCGLCIDACDNIMTKIGKPTGLIGYDTDENIERRVAGKEPVYEIVRPRTVIYAAIIALVGALMLYALLSRDFAGISVLHDRNPIFVTQSDGSVRNGYTVRLMNKRNHARSFVLNVEGMPGGSRIEAVGIDQYVDGRPFIEVGPDQTRELRVLVHSPAGTKMPPSTPVTFRLTESVMGEVVTTKDYFKAP